jgi:hypothetical protein
MLFIFLLALITFSIASTAAFFSVYGLAHTFQGAFYAVIVMGTALEAGKLITASFLYRYWQRITLILKTYLCIAVFILMSITSIGIFAFLSKGYQEDTMPLKEITIKIDHLKMEVSSLQARKDKVEKSKDLAINTVVGITDKTKRWQANTKANLTKSIVSEDADINSKLNAATSELNKLEEAKLNTELHVGPIIYIAQALGLAIDDATKYIILLIILVFDPFAVALTIGVNMALKFYKDDQLLPNNIETDINIDTNDQGASITIHPHMSELVNRKQIIQDVRKGT